LVNVRVPPTLTGVLQARLDGLSASERLTLQRASVVGRIFWDSALLALNVETGVLRLEGGSLDEPLSQLRSRELIFRREESAFAGTREFIFKHSILRDVTYEGVLKRLRRVYHARVAAWLVEQSGERVSEYLGVVAEHYERAGESPKALAYLRRAGEQALQVGALREAVGFFERALALAASLETQPDRAALTLRLGETYSHLGELGLAKDSLGKSLSLARESGDRHTLTDSLGHLGRVAWGLGAYDEARAYLDEALALARELGDATGIARAESNLGILAQSLGAYAEAKERYEASLALARAAGDQVGLASALNNLGNVANAQGVYEEAIEHYRASVETFKGIGRKWETAVCLGNLGVVVAALGAARRAEAETYYQESLAICREIGDQFGVANTLGNLGMVACDAGDYPRARGYLSQALKMELRLGAVANALFDLVTLAKLLSETGEQERAVELLGLVLNHPATGSEAKERAEPLVGELRLALSPGVVETALERGRAQPLAEVVAILQEAA
jgi:tetratricopeptide (TPR) repeat protein